MDNFSRYPEKSPRLRIWYSATQDLISINDLSSAAPVSEQRPSNPQPLLEGSAAPVSGNKKPHPFGWGSPLCWSDQLVLGEESENGILGPCLALGEALGSLEHFGFLGAPKVVGKPRLTTPLEQLPVAHLRDDNWSPPGWLWCRGENHFHIVGQDAPVLCTLPYLTLHFFPFWLSPLLNLMK